MTACMCSILRTRTVTRSIPCARLQVAPFLPLHGAAIGLSQLQVRLPPCVIHPRICVLGFAVGRGSISIVSIRSHLILGVALAFNRLADCRVRSTAQVSLVYGSFALAQLIVSPVAGILASRRASAHTQNTADTHCLQLPAGSFVFSHVWRHTTRCRPHVPHPLRCRQQGQRAGLVSRGDGAFVKTRPLRTNAT